MDFDSGGEQATNDVGRHHVIRTVIRCMNNLKWRVIRIASSLATNSTFMPNRTLYAPYFSGERCSGKRTEEEQRS